MKGWLTSFSFIIEVPTEPEAREVAEELVGAIRTLLEWGQGQEIVMQVDSIQEVGPWQTL